MTTAHVGGTTPRAWRQYAQRQAAPVDGREYMHFGEKQWVRTCFGGDVREVELTEDPVGQYYGWIWSKDDDREPGLIQPHRDVATDELGRHIAGDTRRVYLDGQP